jgi:prepilin-type N-terminal cleavage/methylation domain-containing protein
MKTKISNKGFTLIEVLLVITLIGILLTIGLVNFNADDRFIEARNDTRKTHIQILESTLTQYKLQKGIYPDGLTRDYQEICDPDATDCTGFIDLKSYLVPNFLQAIPQDPNDTDNTGGVGYEIAADDATNTVSVRSLQAEGEVIININDPLPVESTVTANTPLAATVPQSPPIVTAGLVLHLDAGNPASYPGSGTTWTNLSDNGNNGTLVNGVGYNSGNLGSLSFDGVNDYVSFVSNPSLTNQVTFETWVKLSSTTPNGLGTIFSRETSSSGSYRMLYNSGVFNWVCATTNNGWYSTSGNSISTSSSSVTPHTQIYQVVGTYNGSNLQLYVNGELRTTGEAISGNILTTGTFYLMRKEASNIDYGKGDIYSHKIYTRALTAAEIQQNFNATRGRFGL